MASTHIVVGRPVGRQTGAILLTGYFCLYAALLVGMHRVADFDLAEPLMVLAILGVGFSLAAWLLTVGVTPLEYSVYQPKRELAIIAGYLIPVIAFITWGLDDLHRHLPSDPAKAIAILIAKLFVFVLVPAFILQKQFGYSIPQLVPMSAKIRHMLVMIGMSALFLIFQVVLGRGLQDIMAAHVPKSVLLYGLPLTVVWLALEAGVVEEFFFRVLLQTRLSAVLKSELGAIVVMSLIFGLAHAPGLYVRTGITQEGLPPHPSLFLAVGYSIVITSVAGFFLGVLWARTRNFAVVVVAHAVGDLLPNFLPTLHSLRLVP